MYGSCQSYKNINLVSCVTYTKKGYRGRYSKILKKHFLKCDDVHDMS